MKILSPSLPQSYYNTDKAISHNSPSLPTSFPPSLTAPYGTGENALFKPWNADDVKFYTTKVTESKKRVDKIAKYLEKKQVCIYTPPSLPPSLLLPTSILVICLYVLVLLLSFCVLNFSPAL